MKEADKHMAWTYFLLTPWTLLLRAWVVSCLWGWFLVEPLGLFAIGTFHCVGLLCLLSCIRGLQKTPEEPPIDQTLMSVCHSVIVLVLGAVAHSFM